MTYNSRKLLEAIGLNAVAFPMLPSPLVKSAETFAVVTLKKQKNLEAASAFYQSVEEELFVHLLSAIKKPQLKTFIKGIDKFKAVQPQDTDKDLRDHVLGILNGRLELTAQPEKKPKLPPKSKRLLTATSSTSNKGKTRSPMDSSAMAAKWDGKDHD